MKAAIILATAALAITSLSGPVQAQTKHPGSTTSTMTEEQKSGPNSIEAKKPGQGTTVSKGPTHSMNATGHAMSKQPNG